MTVGEDLKKIGEINMNNCIDCNRIISANKTKCRACNIKENDE